MVLKDVVTAAGAALERMNEKYCTLSQMDYSKIEGNESFVEHLREKKYLERPFAYEFYHQIRRLMDNNDVDFGGPIIQAEVDKRYQHCFEEGKIPDFIIHVPNNQRNLAIIEFKLATNLGKINSDFQKLMKFKKERRLQYTHGIEVIIGDTQSLQKAEAYVKQLNESQGEEIIVIYFNVDSWKTNVASLSYKP